MTVFAAEEKRLSVLVLRNNPIKPETERVFWLDNCGSKAGLSSHQFPLSNS